MVKKTAGDRGSLSVKWIMYALLIIYCLSLITIMVWMIFTAFKSYIEYYENQFLWPREWTFENFAEAFRNIKYEAIQDGRMVTYNMFSMAGISLIWSVCKSLIIVIFTAAVAYVIAKYKCVLTKFLYSFGIIIMITPIIGSLPSAMVVNKALGVYDNMVLMILKSPTCVFSGLSFMILHAAFSKLPWDYAEAAFIDGSGDWGVLMKVMLPMMLPVCAVIFVMDFLSTWNDYSTFMVWMPSYANLAYGMFNFQANMIYYGGNINQVMAGFTIVMIPTVILYLSCQKLIMSKFTVGGLKG